MLCLNVCVETATEICVLKLQLKYVCWNCTWNVCVCQLKLHIPNAISNKKPKIKSQVQTYLMSHCFASNECGVDDCESLCDFDMGKDMKDANGTNYCLDVCREGAKEVIEMNAHSDFLTSSPKMTYCRAQGCDYRNVIIYLYIFCILICLILF